MSFVSGVLTGLATDFIQDKLSGTSRRGRVRTAVAGEFGRSTARRDRREVRGENAAATAGDYDAAYAAKRKAYPDATTQELLGGGNPVFGNGPSSAANLQDRQFEQQMSLQTRDLEVKNLISERAYEVGMRNADATRDRVSMEQQKQPGQLQILLNQSRTSMPNFVKTLRAMGMGAQNMVATLAMMGVGVSVDQMFNEQFWKDNPELMEPLLRQMLGLSSVALREGIGTAQVVGEGRDAIDRAAGRVADRNRGADGKTQWEAIRDRANAKLRSWRK